MLTDVKLDKKHDRAKRSSLFCRNMDYDEKKVLWPWCLHTNVIKLWLCSPIIN